jgi:valyl-tRNA synthetase
VAGHADASAEADVAELQRLVTEIRRFRSDQGLKPGQRVAARLTGGSGICADHEGEIRALTRLNRPDDGFEATASITVGELSVELDLSGVVDVEAERRRLSKDLAAERKALEQALRKLGNEQFLAKAPETEVDKVRARRTTAESEIARLEAQLNRLAAR